MDEVQTKEFDMTRFRHNKANFEVTLLSPKPFRMFMKYELSNLNDLHK